MAELIIKERRTYNVISQSLGRDVVLADYLEYTPNGDAVFYIKDSIFKGAQIVAVFKDFYQINCYELQEHLTKPVSE